MTKPITDRPLKRAGRKPWEYDEKIVIEVCRRLSEGEILREICEDPHIPSDRVLYGWMGAEPIFKSAYARAREAQMDKWSDDIVTIADDASNDYMERIGKDGEVERVVDPETVQRSKLRIETRLKLMSKLSPRYADKLAVDLSGTLNVERMSDAELEGRIKTRLAALGIEAAGPLLIVPPTKTDEEDPQDVVPEGGEDRT